MKAEEIVEKLRKMTQVTIDLSMLQQRYKQPGIEFQTETVDRLLKQGIDIDVVNAPVILVGEESIRMVSRRIELGEELTVPLGCVKIFLYNWLHLDLVDTLSNQSVKETQIIRLAFSNEKSVTDEEFLV